MPGDSFMAIIKSVTLKLDQWFPIGGPRRKGVLGLESPRRKHFF